jgi:hypothetical protein
VAIIFAVPAAVGQLVLDDDAFAPFARVVRHDVEADLGHPMSEVMAIRKRRFVLAMLDALEDRWSDAVAELDRIRALETDAHAKVMTGLTIRVWADARDHGGDTREAFHDASSDNRGATDRFRQGRAVRAPHDGAGVHAGGVPPARRPGHRAASRASSRWSCC